MRAYFRSIDLSLNRFRWYSLRLQPCLFGGVDLVRSWGRLGQNGGTVRVEHCPDDAMAKARIELAVRIRERRRYIRVG